MTSSPDSPRLIATRILAATLIVLLLPVTNLRAQEAAPQTPKIQVAAPLTLHINILDGEGALNNIRQRTAREPIVQVEDQNHKPVAGVAIIFSMIDGPNGAGGTFNSLTSFRTVTDAQGKAVGRGFQPNSTTGQFTIQVAATMGSVVAAAVVIHQTNSLTGVAAGDEVTPSITPATTTTATTTGRGAFHFFHIIPKWVVVGVVAGAAAGVAIGVTQTNTGATISAGGTTVGAPASVPAGARR